MSDMERVLRDEIAWHEERLAVGVFAMPYDHRARLAALTAALPAPGDAGDYQTLFNAIADATRIEGGHIAISVAAFRTAMLSAAPHQPVSPGEISQAQAQAMREALESIAVPQKHDGSVKQLLQLVRMLEADARAALAAVPDPAA